MSAFQSSDSKPQFSQVSYQADTLCPIIQKPLSVILICKDPKMFKLKMASCKQSLVDISILPNQLVKAMWMDGVQACYPFVLLIFTQCS